MPERSTTRSYDSGQLTELARGSLLKLQEISFAENREYCGVIGIRPDGTLAAAAASRGTRKNCVTLNVPLNWWIVAYYHTHGGYDPQIQSEVPSVTDLQSTLDAKIIGYLATPGGRFWRFDPMQQMAEQICSLGCLGQDPVYREGSAVAQKYSYLEISQRDSRPLFGLSP